MATPCHRGGSLSRYCFPIGCRTEAEGHVTYERKDDRKGLLQTDHPITTSNFVLSVQVSLR